MTAARLNQRETQRQIIDRQAAEIEALHKEIARLKEIIGRAGLSGLIGNSGSAG
jgi:hypothetical protein